MPDSGHTLLMEGACACVEEKKRTGGSGALKAGGPDEIRDREGAGAGGQGNRRRLAVSYRKRERQDRRSCDKKEERNVRENAG